MYKELKNRFIATSMIVVSLVLFSLVSITNFINYRSMYNRADFVTQLISQNKGQFPRDLSNGQDTFSQYGITPESPYATRYFSVFSSPVRDILTTNRDNIVSITGEEIQSLVFNVMTGKATYGNQGNFRFRKTTFTDGTLSVFLDMSQTKQLYKISLQTSYLLLALTLVVVYFIIRLLSKKAIQPTIDVIEKQKLFINDAGHELKTPLSIISSSADVLELTKGRDQWTDNIHKQVIRMNHLVGDMLTLSRYDELNQPDLTDINLTALFKRLLSELSPMAQEKDLTIESDLTEDFIVKGHEDSLNMLFRILIDNAIRYTEPGQTIRITSTKSSGQAQINITNQFPDFPEDQLEKIFERFYRSDASRSRNTGGSGIGLALARTMAKVNKATVSAIKPNNEEITFQVRLKQK